MFQELKMLMHDTILKQELTLIRIQLQQAIYQSDLTQTLYSAFELVTRTFATFAIVLVLEEALELVAGLGRLLISAWSSLDGLFGKRRSPRPPLAMAA